MERIARGKLHQGIEQEMFLFYHIDMPSEEFGKAFFIG
jgi:hypothetical protein